MLRNILVETITDWLDSRRCVRNRKVALIANFLRRLVVLCTLMLLPAASAFSQGDPSPAVSRKDDQEEIKQAIVSRGDAFAAGNCEKFESYVTFDVIAIEGGLVTPHEVLTKECRGRNTLPDFKPESFRSDFQFRFLGDVVVVTYVGKKVEHIGELTPVDSYRGVDVLKKQNGKWLLSVFTFVPRFEDPSARKISLAKLDEYLGQYVWVGAPKMIDTVMRDGEKLYLQSTGDDGRTELIWEAGNTFAIHGAGGKIDGMIVAADKVLPLADNNTKIVPGHGPLGNKADLTKFRDMLVVARDRVQKLKTAGKSADEIAASKPFADLDATWGKGFFNGDVFAQVVYSAL